MVLELSSLEKSHAIAIRAHLLDALGKCTSAENRRIRVYTGRLERRYYQSAIRAYNKGIPYQTCAGILYLDILSCL